MGRGVHIHELKPEQLHGMSGPKAEQAAREINTWARRAHDVLMESDPETKKRIADMEVHVHLLGPQEFKEITGTQNVFLPFTFFENKNGPRSHIVINAGLLTDQPPYVMPALACELAGGLPDSKERLKHMDLTGPQPTFRHVTPDSIRAWIEYDERGIGALRKMLRHPKLIENGELYSARGPLSKYLAEAEVSARELYARRAQQNN